MNKKTIIVTKLLVNAKTMVPARPNFKSLRAHFTQHGYPAPHLFAQLWPRLTADEQEFLAASVRRRLVQEPITTFGAPPNEQIADGIARCLAAIEAGHPWEDLPKSSFDGDEADLLEFLIDKNFCRRHLDESQRAMVAARLATMKQGARTDLAQICAKSQREAADRLNVSRRLVQYADDLQDKGVLELQNAVDDGKLPVSLAVQAVMLPPDTQRTIVSNAYTAERPGKAFKAAMRNLEIQSRHRQIIAGARRRDLGLKRYPILSIDFPWDRRISWATDPYPRLAVEEACRFQVDDGRLVREVIADDAVVFLWILDMFLYDFQHQPLNQLCEALGNLKPRHLLVWPKSGMKTGHHARYQHETCLVCTRGKFATPEESLRPSTLIVGAPLADGSGFHFAFPHDGRHSSKTDRLPEMIERAYPQYFGPETVDSPLALELFARNYRPKWDGQGFEYPGRPGRHDAEQVEPEMNGIRPADHAAQERPTRT